MKVFRATIRDTGPGRRIRTWYLGRTDSSAAAVTERRGLRKVESDSTLVVESTEQPFPRRGLYLFGGCDLPAAFDLEPMLDAQPRGTVAIYREPQVNLARSVAPVALQTLDDLPEPATRETVERLGLPADYFQPVLFDPYFQVPGFELEPFPKSVVMLSAGAEMVRTLYRHREHGFVVDPGGGWLEGVAGSAALDRETMAWFAATFEKVGRIDLDHFVPVYRRLIESIRRYTGGDVVVFNTLTVDPGEQTHNYQLRRNPEGIRRRRFHLALVEIARELDVAVLDVDRTLKWSGIDAQLDFAHFPTDKMKPLAAELHTLLRSRGML